MEPLSISNQDPPLLSQLLEIMKNPDLPVLLRRLTNPELREQDRPMRPLPRQTPTLLHSDAAVRVGPVLAGFLRTENRTLGSVQEIC